MDRSRFDAGSEDPAALQRILVDRMVREGVIHSVHVEAAFRAVPRHLFLPGVPIARVYSDTSIVTKTSGEHTISSSSQPSMMAIMLEELNLQPGQQVMEVGTGTGYNAALLAYMVGAHGQVVTIDIDEDIVETARAHLAAAGYSHIGVIYGDGGAGYAHDAPYDRIIVTVGADDIPPAWNEQLRPGGRLVVPLGITSLDALSGHKLLAAFDRIDGQLESRRLSHCRFVPLRGAFGTHEAAPLVLSAQSEIRLIADNADVDAASLAAVLDEPYSEIDVDVVIHLHELYGLRLWLALHEPDFCDILTRDGGDGHASTVTIGLCHHTTLALLTSPHGLPSALERPAHPGTRHALLVHSFGPDEVPGRRLAAQILAWDRTGRPFCHESGDSIADVILRAVPVDVPYRCAPDEVALDRRSTRLVFSWR
jgi:protein-L-isoaspartate(D-aspartate) O-methyltransferase